MADAKLVVICPRPEDVAGSEEVYQRKHVPVTLSKLDAQIEIVVTRILDSPEGIPPFYRIAETHFPSTQALEARPASEGGKEMLAHAMKISSGGPPIFRVAEEQTPTFTQTAVD